MGKDKNLMPGAIYGRQLGSMDAVHLSKKDICLHQSGLLNLFHCVFPQYTRHKRLMHDYAKYYGQGFTGAAAAPGKSDLDVLRENWKFVRSDEDNDGSTWEKRMAKGYYEKLFKEYCLADLSQYEHGKVEVPCQSQSGNDGGLELIFSWLNLCRLQ